MTTPTHKFYEDILAIFCAGILVSLGVVLFNVHGLLAGGTAGIALVASNLLPVSFGVLFFLINLPFYYLAWTQLGRRFTINTFVSVSMVSLATEYMHKVIQIQDVHPIFASVVGGMLIGVGLLILFRHSSSLGGLGILAIYLQNKFGWRAGKFQMAVDCTILLVSAIVFPLEIVVLSVVSAIVMNIQLAVNHKPGRYQTDSIDSKTMELAGIEPDVFEEMNEELLTTAR